MEVLLSLLHRILRPGLITASSLSSSEFGHHLLFSTLFFAIFPFLSPLALKLVLAVWVPGLGLGLGMHTGALKRPGLCGIPGWIWRQQEVWTSVTATRVLLC